MSVKDWADRGIEIEAPVEESGSSSSFSLDELDEAISKIPVPPPPPTHKWRADFDALRPVWVEVSSDQEFDADGCKVYINSHFETEDEAWERLEGEIFASVSQAGDHVKQAEENLRLAQAKAGEHAKRFARFWAGDRKRRG